MTRRGISISVKLIAISTILLVFVIGLFGLMNSMQSRRIIDEANLRLRDKISEGLRRTGTTQLELLAATTRIALEQSDYSTLQSIISNIARQDERVVAAGVVDGKGTLLAHSEAKKVGQRADASLYKVSSLTVIPQVLLEQTRLMTFVIPVEHERSRLCTVFLAYSLAQLQIELDRAEQVKRKELVASLRKTLVVGLISVLLGVGLTILQGIRISRPITALARQADQIAKGDLLARVEVSSKDEIGFLGDRFNFMAEQVINLMHQTAEKAALEKELEVASAVQATLVPDGSVVKLQGLEVAGFFRPATRCGGDWWSYYSLPLGLTLIIIGDVTGHGAASAMITAAAKGSATTVTTLTRHLDLRVLLRSLNIAIHDAARGKLLMTCFAAVYDPSKQKLFFANAGHNFPYYYEARSGKLSSLVVRGNRLGDLESSEYEIREAPVNPLDTVIWFTDGLVECEDATGEEFGDRRLRAAIKGCATRPVDQVRDQIIEAANQFFGEVPIKDDITLVVGRFS